MNWKTMVVVTAVTALASVASFAQVAQQGRAIASSDVLSQISMFNYREGRKSDLYFRGTPIAANADGKVRVEYQNGNARIRAQARRLPEPGSLGPYTVYVLWALTPDGRAINQGVLAGPDGGKGKMDTLYGASQFALVVTAEPHFAATVPSTMIALYNVADNVRGEESRITTLTERTDYASLAPIAIADRTSPPEIVQAHYAIAIAAAAGAERFAPEAYATANEKLAAAEAALLGRRSERRTAPGFAREAVIAGEDARRGALIASAAQASDQQLAAAARAATDAANEAAARAAAQAATAADAARELATAAERERAAAAARADLLARLNSALPTRESQRGLISEIGGVHFATGTADLDVPAREGLARLSGIVASYPDLRFNIEGHTDSVGGAAMNNELSLRRAMSARDYLIGQGVPASSIDVQGFGFSMPVGDNSTSDGRARNRRVEIVISGGLLAQR
jgi:outer membrane protein OmpA-like peptidoglycan-associated protein